MTPATESLLLWTAVLLLAAAAIAALVARRLSNRADAPSIVLAAAATGCLVAAMTGRILRENQGPFLTLYDVLLSNLASLAVIFLAAAALSPALRATRVLVLPFLALLGVWALTVPAAAEALPATFDNPWLWLHVVAGKLFLGLCMLAAAAALLLLGRRRWRLDAADTATLDAALWPSFSLAFLFHSFMLVAGAVWAYSAWGRYWAWDPLETWAFVTWLAMAIILHARLTWRRLPAAVSLVAVPGVFVVAFLTFFGVPFLSVAPHKGVF